MSCVRVYVTISGCQLQFCGPEENTVVSLRALLVPLSYRCAGLPLCQFQCVYVCVPLLQETKLTPQALEFLIRLDIVENLPAGLYRFKFLTCCLSTKRKQTLKPHFLEQHALTHVTSIENALLV